MGEGGVAYSEAVREHYLAIDKVCIRILSRPSLI